MGDSCLPLHVILPISSMAARLKIQPRWQGEEEENAWVGLTSKEVLAYFGRSTYASLIGVLEEVTVGIHCKKQKPLCDAKAGI